MLLLFLFAAVMLLYAQHVMGLLAKRGGGLIADPQGPADMLCI